MSTKYKKIYHTFIVSQSISDFGSSLVQYALIWYLLKRTNSGGILAISSMCTYVPQILISFLIGALIDRYNRISILAVSDGSIAMITLGLSVIIFKGNDSIILILLLMTVRSCANAIFVPTNKAILGQIVPQEYKMKATSIYEGVKSAVNLVAPAVGGMLLELCRIEYILLIDVFTASIGICCLFRIRNKIQTIWYNNRFTLWQQLKNGMAYIAKNDFIAKLLIINTIFSAFVIPMILFNDLYVIRSFGGDYSMLMISQLLFCVGTILGSVIIISTGGFKNRITTIIVSSSLFGGILISISMNKVFVLYLALIFLCGILLPIGNTPITVLIQEYAATSMQGRIFSILQLQFSVVIIVEGIILGPLSDKILISYILGGDGILIIIFSVFVYKWKSLSQMAIDGERKSIDV